MTKIKPIDIHTHIFRRYYQQELEEVISKSSSHLSYVLNVACDKKMIEELRENIHLFPENIYFAAGFHPHEANKVTDEDLNYLKNTLKSYPERFIALGEIGLDFFKKYAPCNIQCELLEKQLALVKDLQLPLIIHCRSAYREIIPYLKKLRLTYNKPILLHCYSGDLDLINQFLDLGCYFSLGGTITFKNNKLAPQLVKAIPLARLFPETDAPYLTPHPFRGKTNYPYYVTYTIEKISQFLNLTTENLNEQFLSNWNAFFGLKPE